MPGRSRPGADGSNPGFLDAMSMNGMPALFTPQPGCSPADREQPPGGFPACLAIGRLQGKDEDLQKWREKAASRRWPLTPQNSEYSPARLLAGTSVMDCLSGRIVRPESSIAACGCRTTREGYSGYPAPCWGCIADVRQVGRPPLHSTPRRSTRPTRLATERPARHRADAAVAETFKGDRPLLHPANTAIQTAGPGALRRTWARVPWSSTAASSSTRAMSPRKCGRSAASAGRTPSLPRSPQ